MGYQEQLNVVNDCILDNHHVRDKLYELVDYVNHLSAVFERVYLEKMSLSSDLQGMICNNTTDGVVADINHLRRYHYSDMSNSIQECRGLIDVQISNIDIQISDYNGKRKYYQRMIERDVQEHIEN